MTIQPKTMEDIEEQLKIHEEKIRKSDEITKLELSDKYRIERFIKARRHFLEEELNKRNEAIEKYPWLKGFDSVKVEISDSLDNSMENRQKRFGFMSDIRDKIEDEYEIITAVRKI